MYSKYTRQVFFFSFILFYLMSLQQAYSQSTTATIKGKIIDQKGEGIPFVNVILQNTSLGTLSDEDGNYILNRVPADNYTIEASSEGYQSYEDDIKLDEGDVMRLNLTIQFVESLGIVNIVSNGNPVTDKRSAYVARMPLKSIENPQSYDVIPEKQFHQQMVMSFGEALNYVGGNSVVQTGTKGKEGMALRGFGIKTRIKDGMSNFSKTAVDPANIEKIEVIRGPSATLFGANLTSFGGLTNVVTKKPYKKFGGSLNYIFRSVDNVHRTEVDVNVPIDKQEKVMFRLNLAGETGDTWQDAGYKKSIFLAPALTWEINDNLKLDISSEIYDGEFTTPYYLKIDKAKGYKGIKDIPIDWKKAYNVSEDMPFYAKQYNVNVHLHAKMGHNWESDTKVAINNNPMDGFITTLIAIPGDQLYHETKYNDQRQMAQQVQQNFHYNKEFGDRWENKLLLGLDYYHFKAQEKANTVKFDTINFKNPDRFYKRGFNLAEYEARASDGKLRDTQSESSNFSAYFSDVISLDDRWFFMASLRVDHFSNKGEADHLKNTVKDMYNQTAVSPKFGLVYQVVKDKVSLFGNYMNSFDNVNGVDRNGHTFKPEHANQSEAGVKLSLFDKRLVSTASFYNINVSDILRDDPIDYDYSIQDGKRISRGVDVNLSYNPISGLNIQAAYGHNFSKYTKTNDDEEGRRPYKAGPKNTANLWASYKVLNGTFEGLGLAFGGFYGSSQNAVKKRYDFYMSDYMVLNTSIFYEHPRYRMGVKWGNFTNEDYWDYRLRKHNPSSVSVNLTLKI